MVNKNQGVSESRICKWPEDNMVPLRQVQQLAEEDRGWNGQTLVEEGFYAKLYGLGISWRVCPMCHDRLFNKMIIDKTDLLIPV